MPNPSSDAMERLLEAALGGQRPELSSGFDDRVLRRVRPRRLSAVGRRVMAVYAVGALAGTAWCLQGVPITQVVAAILVGPLVAAAGSLYARRIALPG